MSDFYTGEIRMTAATYAPYHWTLCNGQLGSISSQQQLFAVIGTVYGGDGVTSFGIPEMRGRIPVGQGQGPGLSNRLIGQRAGVNTVVLSAAEMPVHTHALRGSTSQQNSLSPVGRSFATINADGEFYSSNVTELVETSTDAVHSNGDNQPHNNDMPYLGLNFMMAVQGLFPPRN